jgi:L-2-hydroxyglutarate oxidase LhgO
MKVKKSPVFDVIIIGAGVIGAAIARELSKYNLQAYKLLSLKEIY